MPGRFIRPAYTAHTPQPVTVWCRCARCSRQRRSGSWRSPPARSLPPKVAKATELWLLERTKKLPSVVRVVVGSAVEELVLQQRRGRVASRIWRP